MKSRLDLYLLRETFVPFLIGASAAVLLLVGGLLFEYGQMFLDRTVSLAAVGQVLLYRLPFLVVIAAPVAVAVGTAMAVSRLSRDQEILVMRMAGVSVRRIFMPYLLLGVAMFGVTYWFQEAVTPQSGRAFKRVLYKIALMQTTPKLAPNLVLKAQDYHFSLGLVERRDDGSYHVVDFMAIHRQGGETEIWFAPEADYANGVWTAQKPVIWRFDETQRLDHFVTQGIGRIDKRVPLQDIVGPEGPEEMTREQLREQIERGRASGRDVTALEVQYHTKLSVPFACVIFALFGPVLALAFSRGGGFTGILLSVLVVFAHINLLLLFAKILGESGIVPPVVAAWAPDGIFLLAALLALGKVE